MKVKTLLSNESKWVKNYYEKDGRYCLLEALKKCYLGEAYREARKKVETAINEFSKLRKVKVAKNPSIIRFNDNPDTTFKDIRKVVRAANV